MTKSKRRSAPLDPERVTVDMLASFRKTDPRRAWMKILANLRFARVVHAAVKLRIIEALRTGPKTAREIAGETATNETALYRLLRALSVAGVVMEHRNRRFGLTEAGVLLVSGTKGSCVLPLLDFFEPELVPFDGLVHAVRTGEPAFEKKHGMTFYDYLASRAPGSGARFDSSMNTGAALRSQALLARIDFSHARTVVDVGGGEGKMLASVLEAYPHLRGVLLECPQTAARAQVRLAERDLADRCEVVAGDFFSSIPRGGDAYILSFILHNWDDARCVALLSQCRRSMADGAVLAIVEQVLAPTTQASIVEYLNLSTLEIVGGCERTESGYRQILKAAGFALARVAPASPNPFSVLEARPMRSPVRAF